MRSIRRHLGFWSFAVRVHVSRLKRRYLWGACISLLLATLLWNGLGRPISDFPVHAIFSIPQGSSLSDVADLLYEKRAIRSRGLFTFLIRVLGEGTSVQAGDYIFAEPAGLWSITRRVVHGEFGFAPIVLTVTEGMTVRDISLLLAEKFEIDPQEFRARANDYEGFLFPETYKFLPTVTIDDVVALLARTFAERTSEARKNVLASGHTFRDVVIMASLIEKEARTETNRKIIAGILWRRVELGMPLQVDAVFGYINDRPTYHPSLKDLEVDSPYNTYTHTGLPPGPINNPGLDAILAAEFPTESPYLYYLTGKDGLMHYARTFSEHIQNRKKYLD